MKPICLLLACLLLLCGCGSTKQMSSVYEPNLTFRAVSVQETADTAVERTTFTLWGEDTAPTREIELNDGTDRIWELSEQQGTSALSQRFYARNNGDEVLMARMESDGGAFLMKRWTLESDGLICYYDESLSCWVQLPFAGKDYEISMIELALDDGTSYLLYTPKTYLDRGHQTLEYQEHCDGFLRLKKSGTEWVAEIWAVAPRADCVSDYMILRADEPLLNWGHRNCGLLWRNYTLDDDSRWCFDGYYSPAPTTYEPTGENCFYRCPASYFVSSMVGVAHVHRAAEDLAVAMLDTIALYQNEAGFWPTASESDWLSEDYGIDAGFYDTRYNSDLTEQYVRAYELLGGDRFLDVIETYAAFYADFAETNHYETKNGGWLVEDYCHLSGNRPVHSSLNHHLAECILLYRMADLLDRADLEAIADQMVLGVEDTGKQWIKQNSDLYYCYMPDGTYARPDYEYLTYNDLKHLQELLEETGRGTNETLTKLMDAKRGWMDKNRITAYER